MQGHSIQKMVVVVHLEAPVQIGGLLQKMVVLFVVVLLEPGVEVVVRPEAA